MMTARQSLEELKHLKTEIRAIEEYRCRLIGSMAPGANYQSIGTQHDRRRSQDASNDRLDRYVETGRKLDALKIKVDMQQSQILDAIAHIDNSEARTLLIMRYLEGISCDDIAKKLNYERATIFRHMRTAVRLYEETYNNMTRIMEVSA